MKKLGILTLMILLVSGFVLVAGCIGGDSVVGTWQANDILFETLTLNSDGTGTHTISVPGVEHSDTSRSITWKKVSDGTYSISSSVAYLRDGVLYYQYTPFIKV